MDLASEKRDRRPYKLARKGGAFVAIPEIETPEEDNARTGFLELAQFDAIIAHLPTELRAPVRFAYITGWRFRSEVLPLTTDRVDLQVGTVTLDPGATKNGEGRTFVLTKDLRTALTAQIAISSMTASRIESYTRRRLSLLTSFHVNKNQFDNKF